MARSVRHHTNARRRRTTKRRPVRRRRTTRRSRTKRSTRVSRGISSVVEMRKRQQDPLTLYYANQGEDQDENFFGLSTTQSLNVIVNPLNYGWQNTESDPYGTARMFRGRDIYPRFLKQKLKFDFPTGNRSIKLPMRLQVIWGFCTNPLQFTPYTSPTESAVTQAEITGHVMKQIEDQWNSPDDQLEFADRNKSNIKILGKRWIRPDRTARVGLPQQYAFGAVGATQPYIEGGPPDVTMTISWPMNRKMRLTQTDNGSGAPMAYNNQNWLPFTVLYSPDYDSVNRLNAAGDGDVPNDEDYAIPELNRIQCQYCSCMWYQDP